MRPCPGRLRVKLFPVSFLIYVYPMPWQNGRIYMRCGRIANLNCVSLARKGTKFFRRDSMYSSL